MSSHRGFLSSSSVLWLIEREQMQQAHPPVILRVIRFDYHGFGKNSEMRNDLCPWQLTLFSCLDILTLLSNCCPKGVPQRTQTSPVFLPTLLMKTHLLLHHRSGTSDLPTSCIPLSSWFLFLSMISVFSYYIHEFSKLCIQSLCFLSPFASFLTSPTHRSLRSAQRNHMHICWF